MSNRRSLRQKLVLLVVASVGASIVVATAISLWQQASNYAVLRKQALLATAEVFAASAAVATAERDADRAFLSLRAIGRVPDTHYAEIRTADGRRLVSSGAATRLANDVSIAAEDETSLFALLTSGTVQVTVPMLNGGAEVGRLTLIGGTTDLWPKLLHTLLFTLVGGGTALLIGLLIAWRFQRSITRPLAMLIAAMAKVRQSHRYDISVPNTSDRDIGELVDGFNHMLRDVRDRDERLEAHRHNLENEVAERTHDLREARDAAETANRAKSEFLATMSHEIRTPMNGIMVMAEMLAGGDMPARQRRHAEIIANSGKSLLAIINDILDFSKIEAGKLDLECTALNLNEVAENVTSLFAERARSKSLDLAAFVDPTLPRSIMGDPVRLTQVVTNLVNNALKFTERGFVKLTIVPADDRRSLQIDVSDSGIGIPEDKLATIFEAFSQADQTTTRQFGGTGLGLTICRRLVLAMGGRIGVTSRPGQGSCFSVTIPCALTAAQPWPQVRKGGASPVVRLDLSGDMTRQVLADYLRAAGYELARDDEVPHLICADAARVASLAIEQSRPKPIVAAVCDLGSGWVNRAMADAGIDAVITKPLIGSEVEELLARIAGGQRDLKAAAPERQSSRVATFRRFKALVADDNAVNREVATEALVKLGAEVECVTNGREAVDAIAKSHFDIVFMDGSMPEMDGFEATRCVRRAQAQSQIKTIVVGLTAHVVGTAADEWRSAGMDAVVYKPFTLAELASTIERLLPHLADVEADVASSTPLMPNLPALDGGGPPVLDRAILDQLRSLQSGTGTSFVHKVFGLYVEHAPGLVADIDRAIAADNRADAARAAHALKSMSYNVGAARMADLALAIEKHGRDEARPPMHDLARDIVAALPTTIAAMKAHLDGVATAPSNAVMTRPSRVAASAAPMERALERALERDELSVFYQPIVERNGIQTRCVEALVRWTNAAGESVSPVVFIPVAERSGLIHDLGEWVLRRACEDAVSWPDLDVSINLSPIQFGRSDLGDRIERLITRAGIEPRRVWLEITEGAFLKAEDSVLSTIKQLNARGITFALDDFGTGYSSLTYLRRFPLGRIKIDRSFVSNVDSTVDATIIHAIVSVGRALGIKMVAEGVERQDQHRFLMAAGVHYMQGFLFGRPLTKDAITERMRAERAQLAEAAKNVAINQNLATR